MKKHKNREKEKLMKRRNEEKRKTIVDYMREGDDGQIKRDREEKRTRAYNERKER